MAYTVAMNYLPPKHEPSPNAEIEAAIREHAQIDYGRITSGSASTPEDQAALDAWIESDGVPTNRVPEL